jgi:hypothetical protein
MSEIPNTLPNATLTERVSSASTFEKWCFGLIAVGTLLSLIGIVFFDATRVAFGYLWGFSFAWNLVLGCLFFVALHHATHAVWSVVVRRVAEMYASLMPLVAVMVLPLLLLVFAHNFFEVYPWSNPEHVHGDHILEGKTPYLNIPFFVVRALFFVAVWTAFARVFVGRSLRQDEEESNIQETRVMRRWSVVFFPIFALTITFAAFDWLMSLDPHWFSTIYGVYIFAGMTATGLAAITISVIWLRARGLLGENVVRAEHLYNLGALLFTFTCFWAYIAFSQFMLIWYGNIPEETIYFVERMQPGWKGVTFVLAILRFIVPFFLLLSRPSKSNPALLVFVSCLILVGQMLDLFWLIMPSLDAEAPHLGWQELGPVILLAGVLLLSIAKFLSRHKMLAVGDPLFEQSRNFHL